MYNFNPEYKQLLIRQVREEMEFLNSHGHTLHGVNGYSCFFCYQGRQHTRRCDRLEELQQFLNNLHVTKNRNELIEKNDFDSTLIPEKLPLMFPIN